MNNLETTIESILFYLSEPVDIGFLEKTLQAPRADIEKALKDLTASLSGRGIRLIAHNGQVNLVTAPESSEIIEKITKETREREIGKAGIETLAIVAYKGPISRREIDYIRGVNSQFAVRNLLIRGLIEKQNSSEDERIILYTITLDALEHLGIESVESLPEYASVRASLEVDQNEEISE